MELKCYEDDRPLSPDEQAVLAVRRGSDPSSAGATGTPSATRELALFHVDCFPAESGEWVLLHRGQAGLLHDAPP